jgi:hypothetical protein
VTHPPIQEDEPLSLISTRLAVICLTFPMTAALSAQPVADIARRAQEQRDHAKTISTKTYTNQTVTTDRTDPKAPSGPVDQSRKQLVTLFDLRSVGNSGGVNQTVGIIGRGYAGTPDDRRRAGKTSEPDEEELVAVIVRDAKDPVLPSCLNLLAADVFMEHTVRISGIGLVERRSPDDDPRLVTLRLERLSECTVVPLR